MSQFESVTSLLQALRLEALTEARKVEGVGNRAAVVADLGTNIVRVGKVGGMIIAHPDLSMVTHVETLDGVSAGCRHRHRRLSTAFINAYHQTRGG